MKHPKRFEGLTQLPSLPSQYASFFACNVSAISQHFAGFARVDVPPTYATLKHMSARKIDGAELLQPITVQSGGTRLDLPASALTFRRNGIEFRTNSAIPTWTEMTVSLQTPGDSKRFNCTGVVVACSGSRHTGFNVSMVFINLSRQAQLRLHNLAYSPLA